MEHDPDMADGGSPPSIAFFIRTLGGGGAQRDAVLLANALAERGSRVTLLTLIDQGPLRALAGSAVGIERLGAGKLRAAAPALARALARLKPDVLVSAESAPNLVATLAVKLMRRHLRPKLVLREASSPSAARAMPADPATRLGYRFAGFAYRNADRAITLTPGARDDLVANFGVPAERIAVMEANAVIDRATAQRLRTGFYDVAREPGLIVCMGRLSPEKDQLTAVRAMAKLPAELGARLVLAGDGPLRAEIEALIAALGMGGRVTLAGHVADPFALLARAELALCSSRYEGFGNAIVEALACGTPVVATDCPFGPRVILRDGRDGTLVPPGDADALAAAIAASLAATADRTPLRARGLQFTADRAAAAFEAIVNGP